MIYWQLIICISGILFFKAEPERNASEDENLHQLQFIATINLIDASINSINSLNSLIRKESYRNKIVSFNNPANSDLGFNLENEIMLALEPISSKTKNVSKSKLNAVISSLLKNSVPTGLDRSQVSSPGFFAPILSIIGNLVLSEKRVTREDLDSFMFSTSKYFVQYDRLGAANKEFDNSMNKLKLKLQEIQFDLREFLADLVIIINRNVSRADLKDTAFEDILIQYLNPGIIHRMFTEQGATLKYPADGIKTSKEIVYDVQKLFTEYQKLYLDNYTVTRNIVLQSKELGKTVDAKKIEASLKELDQLFIESKDADIINLRLNTLSERLKVLTACEQMAH